MRRARPFAQPLVTATGTSYTDTALPVTGERYRYKVRALDRTGNESEGTADKAERCFFVDAVDDDGNSPYKRTGEAEAATPTEPEPGS